MGSPYISSYGEEAAFQQRLADLEAANNGGSGTDVQDDYDQIEVDIIGPGGLGNVAETLMSMSRHAVKAWGGVMESPVIEVTILAGSTVQLHWVTSVTAAQNMAGAALHLTKVRDDTGAVVASPERYKARMLTAADLAANGLVTFDHWDVDTADISNADAQTLNVLTSGTYRIYAELDLNLPDFPPH